MLVCADCGCPLPHSSIHVCQPRKVAARDLGPRHIGQRVRVEAPGVAVEATVSHVGHNYRAGHAGPIHSVYVSFETPDDLNTATRLLSGAPSLTLGPDDELTFL